MSYGDDHLPNDQHKYTSPDQPDAPKRPVLETQDYIGHDRKKWLGVQLDVADVAKFYAPDMERGVDRWPYNDHEWDFAEKNEYIPFRIKGAADAMKAIDTVTFPKSIKFQAEHHSRELTDVFDEVARKIVVRDQLVGRVDRRKHLEVAKGFATGKLDIGHIRPYERNQFAQAELPTVAILASGAWAESWHDSNYIPRVLTLTLAIQWACEATGLKVWSGLVQGNASMDSASEYAGAQMIYRLNNPLTQQPIRNYIALLHRSLFHWGVMCAEGADGPGLLKMARLEYPGERSIKDATSYVYHCFPSVDGGYAVHHARTTFNPDMIIAIGNIQDRGKADIQIGADVKLKLAIHKIAEQASNLRIGQYNG